ncbi:hypothetical protein, partial [Limnospira platensis]|uniref:hypothetical protein n=1 Tax=Limnospira platensis TaxID=118562 RepID=UPI003485E834
MSETKQPKRKTRSTLYGENKKSVSMTLTETAVGLLDQMAMELNLNRSELVEQIARGIISSQAGKVSPEQAGK